MQSTDSKSGKSLLNNSTVVSSIYTCSLAGNRIVYTPSHDTSREKYLNHINYEAKTADSGGE